MTNSLGFNKAKQSSKCTNKYDTKRDKKENGESVQKIMFLNNHSWKLNINHEGMICDGKNILTCCGSFNKILAGFVYNYNAQKKYKFFFGITYNLNFKKMVYVCKQWPKPISITKCLFFIPISINWQFPVPFMSFIAYLLPKK